MWSFALAAAVLLLFLGLFLAWRGRERSRRAQLPPVEPPAIIEALPPAELAADGPLPPPPTEIARLPAPVVLCHGMLGFDEIRVGRLPLFYFRGIPTHLRGRGEDVLLVRVPAFAPIAVRAAALARQIEALEAPRVNLVAHSMGGLDARYAIAHCGIAHRVASLTTIGTPHRGTPLVDRTRRLTSPFRRPIAAAGGDLDALFDLSTAKMTAFNEAVPDVPGVRYFSVVGRAGRVAGPVGPRVSAMLWWSHWMLGRLGAESDGLVPVASQAWGDVMQIVPADHFAQIGWSRGFDARGLFDGIVRHLRDQGL